MLRWRLKPPLAAPPEMSEQTLVVRFTSTPPIELMKSRKPLKSTTAMWSIGVPRNFSSVCTVSLAPPNA